MVQQGQFALRGVQVLGCLGGIISRHFQLIESEIGHLSIKVQNSSGVFDLPVLKVLKDAEIFEKGCFTLLCASLIRLQERILAEKSKIRVSQAGSDIRQILVLGSNRAGCRSGGEKNQ